MPKLSKQEFILKAAKLYGLGKVEIGALESHLNGSVPNDFIERRTHELFELYDIYNNSAESNEGFDTDERGIINLNDYSFKISKRRLQDSKIGKFWIINSNLEAYLSVQTSYDYYSDVEHKFVNISDKNNFFLPQIAKQMGLDAAIYYKGEYVDEAGTFSTHHLTKNFLYDEETLIQGNSIIKDNPKKKKVNFETLLEATDKYVKKYYKKNKLPIPDLDKARRDIRTGLIKQTLFNKIVFNENESNEKWGLIIGEDKNLRLAPLYSYDYCAGVQHSNKDHHRVIKGKEDIETFMLQYGKEPWFKSWIKENVLPLNLDKAATDMKKVTGIELEPEEFEYYKFVIEKMHEKVVSVNEFNYNKELIEENKKQRLGKRIVKIKNTVSDKIAELKEMIEVKNQDDDTGER